MNPTGDFPDTRHITDPFNALAEASERIAVLERQVKQLQNMFDSKLPEGVQNMWVPPEKPEKSTT